MEAITYLEFDEMATKACDEEVLATRSDLRVGQIYFNKLYDVRPHVANKLRGSKIDPFFKNRVTDTVKQFVKDNWETE
jgi:hypothetical protein